MQCCPEPDSQFGAITRIRGRSDDQVEVVWAQRSNAIVARKLSFGQPSQWTRPTPSSPSDHLHNSAAPTGEYGNLSLVPRPGSASPVTTSTRETVWDRRNPSAICNPVRMPHVPFAISNEKVPCVSPCGSSGCAPMSSWRDSQVQGAVTVAPVTADDVECVNYCAHTGPPVLHRPSAGQRRSPIRRPARSGRSSRRVGCGRLPVLRSGLPGGLSRRCSRTGRQ